MKWTGRKVGLTAPVHTRAFPSCLGEVLGTLHIFLLFAFFTLWLWDEEESL